jgi:hypothetical protein
MCPALVHGSVEIRGVVYPDIRAAAAAVGVHPNTVRRAIKAGTLHRCGTGAVGIEPMPVRIRGKVYADAYAAAAAHGVAVSTVRSALAKGDPDAVGRVTHTVTRAYPVVIGPVSFPSRRAASRALGFANPDYVNKALRRGSAPRERVLAAAMAYAMRAEHCAGRSA